MKKHTFDNVRPARLSVGNAAILIQGDGSVEKIEAVAAKEPDADTRNWLLAVADAYRGRMEN